jgi:hypothetical protein
MVAVSQTQIGAIRKRPSQRNAEQFTQTDFDLISTWLQAGDSGGRYDRKPFQTVSRSGWKQVTRLKPGVDNQKNLPGVV